MSASLLYHGFGIRGYEYQQTIYGNGVVTFVISQLAIDCAARGAAART